MAILRDGAREGAFSSGEAETMITREWLTAMAELGVATEVTSVTACRPMGATLIPALVDNPASVAGENGIKTAPATTSNDPGNNPHKEIHMATRDQEGIVSARVALCEYVVRILPPENATNEMMDAAMMTVNNTFGYVGGGYAPALECVSGTPYELALLIAERWFLGCALGELGFTVEVRSIDEKEKTR